MDKYIIYCTQEQTEKALNLGAPIEINSHPPLNGEKFMWLSPPADAIAWNNSTNCLVPTAEQMIGWLEEQGIWIHFCKPNQRPKLLSFSVSNINEPFRRAFIGGEYASRKETTLAAIDAALEYLISNKRMNQLITDN